MSKPVDLYPTKPEITSYACTRSAFIKALIKLAEKDPTVCLVLADSLKSARAEEFAQRFPDRCFELGICEQNAICFAAGLASTGLKPFFCTYGGFIAMRGCEQVRTFVAYPGLNVKLVGFNGGIFGGEREGVTHMVFEDLGILRAIPGIEIVVPADADQTYQATLAVASRPGPAYIRIGSGKDPIVYNPPVEFKFGTPKIIKKYGDDAVIFACGPIILWALKATDLLHERGIQVTLVEVHTIKPINLPNLLHLIERTKAVVTVEDHNIIGGLGSAIAEIIAEHYPVPLRRVGLRDVYPESGEANLLFDHFHMGVLDIVNATENVVASKR